MRRLVPTTSERRKCRQSRASQPVINPEPEQVSHFVNKAEEDDDVRDVRVDDDDQDNDDYNEGEDNDDDQDEDDDHDEDNDNEKEEED